MKESSEEKPKFYPEGSLNPSDEYMEEVGKTFDRFYRWRLSLTNEWKQLQGYQLIDYVKSSRNKMYGFEPLNSEANLNERPQFLSHEFRTQAEQILMQVANLSQNPRFYSTEGLNFQIAEILNGLHRHATRGVGYKLNNLLDYWHTIMDGTVIKYVSYAPHRKKVRNVKKVDLTTGHIEYTETEIKEGEVEEVMCDITSFYVPKIFEPDIQKQGEAMWVQDMTWRDFQNAFKDYPNASAVVPGNMLMTDSIFARVLDKSVLAGDKVQLVKDFDWVNDRYKLMANGIWINPQKGSKDETSPMPWNHKMGPFAKTQYRFTDSNFFYGPSLPHLVKSPVEAREELQEMKLDRVFRTLNPSMLTTEPTIPQDFKLESGAVYHTNVNPSTEWKEIELNEMDQNVWRMDADLDSMTSRISMPTQSTPASSKQPKSAAEKILQQQQMGSSFGFQKLFFQHLLEQKAILTVENMLQFYTSTDMKKTIGGKSYMNILNVENVPLKTGIANLELRFTKSKGSVTAPDVLAKQKLFHAIFNHENREIIEASYDIFKDLMFEVEIDFDEEETPALKKAMFQEFLSFMMQTFGQQIDQNKAMFRAFEIWNENPADWIPDQMAKNYPAYLAGIPVQQPQQNPIAALMQGMGGGGGKAPGGGAPQPNNAPAGQRVKQALVRGPLSGRGNSKFGQKGANIGAMIS